jgi:KipI family sensor histidine kinase inhibitor
MTEAAIVRPIPLGDAAILLHVDGPDDEVLERRIRSLTRAVEGLHATDARFGRPVPGLSSVLVPVDPLDPGVDAALPRLADLASAVLAGGPATPDDERDGDPLVRIPTRYGGEHGPDLEAVAAAQGLRPSEVVELHASTEYRVRFLGFVPGFAYLGRLPAAIATPRLDTPRERVPAGSVAIAGEQTAVYPSATPGGWRLIGRTELRVWDPAAASPALLLPGTRVRFDPGP